MKIYYSPAKLISFKNLSQYTITNASAEDIDSIVKITRQKENRKALPWVMKVVLKESIENPKKNILLVVKTATNDVIGFARSYCRRDKVATLHEIALSEEVKGIGLGSRLIAKTQEIAKRMDCNSLQLKLISEFEKLQNFYKKNGFSKIGEQETKKRLLYIFNKSI